MLLDMRSGTRRVLDKHPGTGAYVEADAVFSPDGSQVAYHVAAIDGMNSHQIRIVPVDGSSAPRIVWESKKANSEYVFVKGWTPDGRRLLISPELTDQTWQLSMLSITDGTVQTIKSFGWAQVHAALSPDGRYIAYAVPVSDDDVTRDLFIIAVGWEPGVPARSASGARLGSGVVGRRHARAVPQQSNTKDVALGDSRQERQAGWRSGAGKRRRTRLHVRSARRCRPR